MSFKNPVVPLIDVPVNIDRPIQELQQGLAEMGWLEKSFGRSWQSYRNDPNGKQIIYPEVWQGATLDLLNCMPNDNLKSQSFFKLEDPVEVLDFNPGNFSMMRARISIIFWFNLKFINPNLDYRFIETLKGHVQRTITGHTFSVGSSITIVRIWEEADNVFRGYTIDKTKQQELVHPYGGFRFECTLNYREDCPGITYTDGLFDFTFDNTFN